MIITLTVAGCLSYAVGRQLAGRMGGALVFAVFQLGFAFLLSQPWLYAWDYLDLIIFFAFIDFVLRRKTLPWFVGLFAVGIFNRESALFIALWLVLDPIARRLTEPSGLERRRLDRRSIVAGVCCLAAGSAVIAGLRSALLIEETGPRLFGFTLSRPAIEVLAWNLGLARQYFLHPDFYMPFTVPLFLMGTVLIAIVVARRWPRQLLGLSLIHVAMVGALLTIGYLPETRVYLDLLPFIATACVLITAQEVDIVG